MNIQELKQQSKVHFIGLGGIGMSALAFILREWKISVQGSDLSENYLTPKLRDKGVTYFVGHKTENISDDVSLIVATSIIKTDNPEIIEAQKRNIPVITRANLLALIMREYKGITIAGTHGKTSTTGIVSLMLEIGEFNSTYFQSAPSKKIVAIAVKGTGEWSITIDSYKKATLVGAKSATGVGTTVVNLGKPTSGIKRITWSHTGEGVFSVSPIDAKGRSKFPLFLKIGDYTGTVMLQSGTQYFDIKASGDWKFTIK
jgi:UDP-N-acetylmuramate-alanine ligase